MHMHLPSIYPAPLEDTTPVVAPGMTLSPASHSSGTPPVSSPSVILTAVAPVTAAPDIGGLTLSSTAQGVLTTTLSITPTVTGRTSVPASIATTGLEVLSVAPSSRQVVGLTHPPTVALATAPTHVTAVDGTLTSATGAVLGVHTTSVSTRSTAHLTPQMRGLASHTVPAITTPAVMTAAGTAGIVPTGAGLTTGAVMGTRSARLRSAYVRAISSSRMR